ncbi:hypothetical protein [Qipengyuania sp. MTN3-11]|uniref:hypothetical protein n=1 Tax=Qipengyuania sp. MTN3-11 TaxID=3056557 RepID=UPI0036F302FA
MKRLLPIAALLLAACGEEPSPEPTPSAEPTVAAPRTLIAADFDPAMLGAKIEGPEGPEVEAAIMAEGREIGRIRSFVACPEGTAECVPGELPADTVYTYVHEVTLAEDLDPVTAEARETEGALAETSGALFRMTRPATGFNRSVGYSRAQAETALGLADAITVTSDADQIIWRVTGGSGWKRGTAITFWWQSVLPPEGPAEAYQLEVRGMSAPARGPFPPAEMPVEGEAAN